MVILQIIVLCQFASDGNMRLGYLEAGGTNLTGLSKGSTGSSSQFSEDWALFMLGRGFYEKPLMDRS